MMKYNEPLEDHEEEAEPLQGKDELNLAEFPIALLTEKAPDGVRTLEYKDQIFDAGKKKLVNRRLKIEGSENYGLPTAKDDEVILALIQLSKRRKFDDRAVEFTRYELICLLGWPNTGQSYARIELALRRWVSVTLHYENAWWDKSEERWTSGAFHIIDDFELNDSRETTPQLTFLTSRIIWSARIFDSFVDGHLKNIRYDVYLKLRSAISKRMFRFLDKRFHHSKKVSFELRDFAHEHIGLSRSYKDCGKLKEKLNIAVKELEEIGFIEALPAERRYQHEGRGCWRVTFTRGPKTMPPPKNAGGPVDQAALPIDMPEPPLVTELARRGVTRATAAELVRQHPAERIAAKLEVFDWLTERQDKRIAKSPEGYLCDSIRKDYATPRGFVSSAERQRRQEAAEAKRRAEAEKKQQKQEETAREDAERKQLDAYWKGLTRKQQAELEAKALAAADETMRQTYESLKRSGAGDGYLALIRREHIRQILQSQQAEA